ncbi:MAG: hypothetical protein GYB65_18760 [Chloroflexi bacterium]|nr:hypothetical protein [Chloroflexota bacterium]
MSESLLDVLLAKHPVPCQVESMEIQPDEIVHVVGTQEPVRDQPDSRAQLLLRTGWLKVDLIQIALSPDERAQLVTEVQGAARNWLKQAGSPVQATERDQVRWLVEKTRSHESALQIGQRVWLALVLHGLGCRGLRFDNEGQIHWQEGLVGRIGLAPDAAIDLAWSQPTRQTYTASFRQPDGTITRGKGRRRWFAYRLTIDPSAAFLFEQRAQKTQNAVALIVASEIHATQPQLPRDFYGGDAFQQACIDAQDQSFDHILVVSPKHGIISLDDTVDSETTWDSVLEGPVWNWQQMAVQRLGMYLFGKAAINHPQARELNWWAWLNPETTYELTVFGDGFTVQMLLDHLIHSGGRMPHSWPQLRLGELKPGYDAGEMEETFDFDFDLSDNIDFDDPEYQAAMQDINILLEWSTEFVELVSVYVSPINELWTLAADEALIPVRILTASEMDIEELLDLLTDISLLLEHPLPFTMLINAGLGVSTLLQITHSLVHDEREAISALLDVYPEDVLRQYVEKTLQETSQEDRLCACLTLAEQLQLLHLAIDSTQRDQLMLWLQTYISTRMRPRILGSAEGTDKP